MITKMPSNFMKPDTSNLDRAAFLVGTPIAHSSSPALHHAIYTSKNKNYGQILCETDDLASFLDYIRHEPKCMGSGVTMPYKVAVIPFLDELTPEARTIGAVNTIFFASDPTNPTRRKFIGTNTDCIGIRDAFLNNLDSSTYQSFRGKPGLIIGGGGTCRAAVYSLKYFLGCSKIYIINRDKSEVDVVLEECRRSGLTSSNPSPSQAQSEEGEECEIIHVESLSQAQTLPAPIAIVSAVPDFTPVTEGEKSVRDVLTHFLQSAEPKGALLEMCYHPSPLTQISRLSEENGWKVIGGIEAMIGQGLAQAGLWSGLDMDLTLRSEVRKLIVEELDRKTARKNVEKIELK